MADGIVAAMEAASATLMVSKSVTENERQRAPAACPTTLCPVPCVRMSVACGVARRLSCARLHSSSLPALVRVPTCARPHNQPRRIVLAFLIPRVLNTCMRLLCAAAGGSLPGLQRRPAAGRGCVLTLCRPCANPMLTGSRQNACVAPLLTLCRPFSADRQQAERCAAPALALALARLSVAPVYSTRPSLVEMTNSAPSQPALRTCTRYGSHYPANRVSCHSLAFLTLTPWQGCCWSSKSRPSHMPPARSC